MYILTGCAGFIGYHVSRRLLESGEQVFGIDEMNDSTDQRLKRWRLDQLRRLNGFAMFKADISRPETVGGIAAEVRKSGEKPAALLNLAGRAGVQPSVDNPQLYFDANVTGTLNMMDLCRHLQMRKFVSASSSSVYGNSSVGPTSEDSQTNSPLSPYAASKKAAEVLAYSYHHLHVSLTGTAFNRNCGASTVNICRNISDLTFQRNGKLIVAGFQINPPESPGKTQQVDLNIALGGG